MNARESRGQIVIAAHRERYARSREHGYVQGRDGRRETADEHQCSAGAPGEYLARNADDRELALEPQELVCRHSLGRHDRADRYDADQDVDDDGDHNGEQDAARHVSCRLDDLLA